MPRIFEIVKIKFGGSSIKNKTIKGDTVNSSSPMTAAGKAMNIACKNNKVKKSCSSTIVLKDTASGKEYSYKVKRKLINKTVMIAGKPVLFKYDNEIKAA
jgi:hypothetical protein